MVQITSFHILPLALGVALTRARQEQLRGHAVNRRADVYYLTDMADRFALHARTQTNALQRFHASEEQRLQRAMYEAQAERDKLALEDAATLNEQSRMEAQSAYNEMLGFASTLKQAMGSENAALSCAELTCGAHAFCGTAKSGVRCLCQAGYEGDGFVCNSPQEFSSRALVSAGAGRQVPTAADIHVVGLAQGLVVAAFRDRGQADRGFLAVGVASPAGVAWNAPVPFSGEAQAFGVQLANLGASSKGDGSSIAITYRDKNMGGVAMLLSARIGADGHVVLGSSKAFARNQAQQMAVVPLEGFRVAILFAEHVPLATSTEDHPRVDSFGAAMLAHLPPGTAAPQFLGKYRFAEGAVARLSVAELSKSSFVVAYRHAQESGAVGIGSKAGEASCVLAQVYGDKLAFDLRTVSLENRSEIWARSVVPVKENIFAYTYHSGSESLTKQAMLRVDPKTFHLEVLQAPQVIANGFSQYAGGVSSGTNQGARFFNYYAKADDPARLQARMCSPIGPDVALECKELPWIDQDITSVAGCPISDGRLLFVYASAQGFPWYQLVGVAGDPADY